MMKSSSPSRSSKVEFAAAAKLGRNIVVCCDGTGIGEDHHAGEIVTPSNIVKIFNCVDTTSTATAPSTVTSDDVATATATPEEPVEQQQQQQQQRGQIAYYERGVGSVGNVLTKAGRGLTGYGVGTKIKIMYHWIGVHWREYATAAGSEVGEEDRLFLFGFSRGAFAVRSLAGMLYRVGLLDLRGLNAKESNHRVHMAFEEGYRRSRPKCEWAKDSKSKKSSDNDDDWPFFGDEKFGRIPIHFVGAFDTVGQLGMPRESWCLWACGALCCSFTADRAAFHDILIHDNIRNGIHAVAIDEMRSTFQPVFSRAHGKSQDTTGRDIRQVWFPGCHANIGGGVLDSGLSDITLKFMLDEAASKGLRFKQNMMDQIKPNFQGNIFHKHGTTLYKNMTFYPRSVPAVIHANSNENNPHEIETVHISAIQRSQNPRISQAPYFDTTYLQVGEQHQVLIQAGKVYNSTCVYLEAGAVYDMTADGIWSGFSDHACGPKGYSKKDLMRRPFQALRVGIGQLERGWRKISGNDEARLPSTRRHDHFPWFTVMGMVTSGGTRNAKAEADFHAVFCIGEHVNYQVGEQGGYLYCYANDTWSHYKKNKGAMSLTITRKK